jgi:hypothetical protein
MIYILSTLLLVSLSLLFVGVWYIRNLLIYSHSLVADFKEINENLKSFEEHIKKVYEMDRFYGDGTLEGLLHHAQDITTELGDFITQKNNLFEDEQDEKKETQ